MSADKGAGTQRGWGWGWARIGDRTRSGTRIELPYTRVRLPCKPASEPSSGQNLLMVELWELVF